MTELEYLPAASRVRVEALRVRWQIEECTRRLMVVGTGDEVTYNTQIGKRLRLLYLQFPPEPTDVLWRERRSVILQAHMVYRRACDIVHGRSTAQELSPTALNEWHDVVTSLVAVTDEVCQAADD